MKIGNEDRQKLIIAGVLGFVLIGVGYYFYSAMFGGPATPAPAAPVVTTVALPGAGAEPASTSAVVPATVPAAGPRVKEAGAVKGSAGNAQLDPTLHMGGMRAAESLVYTGTGRNIFAPGSPMVVEAAIPKPIASARTIAQAASVVPVRTGPAPPPPINLKFFGVATQNGKRRALLLQGDDVFLASTGDVIARRYRIVAINTSSITVEDMPNTNKQNLPLLQN